MASKQVEKIHILLTGETADGVIRTTDPQASSDRYLSEFKKHNLHAIKVPTLDYKLVNQSQLEASLKDRANLTGTKGKKCGLLITSPRAVLALEEVLKSDGAKGLNLAQIFEPTLVFSIGQLSATMLDQSLGLKITDPSQMDNNAESLTELMVQKLSSMPSEEVDLLFPSCPRSKMDQSIEGSLKSLGNIHIDKLIVYESDARTDVAENIAQGLKGFLKPELKTLNLNLIFFSGHLDSKELKAQLSKLLDGHEVNVTITALGPVTAKSLECRGEQLLAVSEKPNPEYLVKAMLNS